MSVLTSTYYGLTRVREQSPDANNWAVTDSNVEALSRILKSVEQHKHTGVLAPKYPGFYDPPPAPTITPQGTTGSTGYSYYVVGIGPQNKVSGLATISNGVATLSTPPTAFNRLTWPQITGATSYDIVRVAGGTTQGYIGSIASGVGTATYDDLGQDATLYTPVGEPDVTIDAATGILTPGTSLGIRLAYENALGLETQASPERLFTFANEGTPPLAPIVGTPNVATNTIPGGTYFYVLTKTKASGETQASEVATVSLPYNTTCSVPLTFDPIASYTDGTTGINIYRSSGFNAAFELVASVTTAGATTYTDTNTIANPNKQPPTSSSFGANKAVRISWSDITIPDDVTNLKVYVTQQSGIWSTNHLLAKIPIVSNLATNPVTAGSYLIYYGNESLDLGAPLESSQIPDDAPLLNIGSDTLIPYYVNSYPTGAITNGTTIFYEYTDSSAGKVVWTLRYDTGDAKWYFVGGGPLTTISATEMFTENSSTVTDSPVLVLPRPGKYIITFGSQQAWTSAAGGALLNMALVSVAPATGAVTQLSMKPAWGRSDTTDQFESVAATDTIVFTSAETLHLRWRGFSTQCRAQGNYISVIPIYMT